MKHMIALLVCLTLTACGGGGGDDEGPEADNRPPRCQENPKLCE